MKHNHKFHFLYKVTCPRSGKYYIGIHSTNHIEDGYEGSGVWVARYQKKHGKGVLKREILSLYDTRDNAKVAEENIVTEDLISSDFLCMNMIPGGTGFCSETASRVNKGRTKENDPGRRSMAEKLSGRTKETHNYLVDSGKKISEALTGRTKETHTYIENVASMFRSRNKDNHPGVLSQSQKMSGRTKETHESVRKQSEKMSGRSKETHSGVRSQSLKIRKISEDQDVEIALLKNQGLTIKEIIEKLSLTVTYYTVVNAIKRGNAILSNKEKTIDGE